MATQTEKDEHQAEDAPKKKSGAILIGVAALMGGAGFAVPYLVPSLVGIGDGDRVSQSPFIKPEKAQDFILFGEVTVNLDEARLNRYLRTSITLQVDKSKKKEIEELVTKRKVSLKNWLLGFLADLNMDEIRGAAGQNRIRRQIQDHFNGALFDDGYDRIHEVLFEEFNVQ
jgi:flagellar basal body-associated protein FliL